MRAANDVARGDEGRDRVPLAHSVDGKWVEVAIALSVALVALNNLMPFVPDTRWSLAFALGLLNGFGFVSAIQDLGASARALWVSVLGFNLGVEAGQLAIVAAFVPLTWVARARPQYVKVLLPLGSALISRHRVALDLRAPLTADD